MCPLSLFCYILTCVLSSFSIISLRKGVGRELYFHWMYVFEFLRMRSNVASFFIEIKSIFTYALISVFQKHNIRPQEDSEIKTRNNKLRV